MAMFLTKGMATGLTGEGCRACGIVAGDVAGKGVWGQLITDFTCFVKWT